MEKTETKTKKSENLEEKQKEESKKQSAEQKDKQEEKVEEKKVEEKKSSDKKIVKEKPKKSEAVAQSYNLPISTKHSTAVCKFIKNKKIEDAINDLEFVIRLKKAVPMKGEIPHRKGKGMMSGRFPKKSAGYFLNLLKSLSANSDYNGLKEPIIVEAVANIGVRPYGRFGSVRKKRTHVKIVAKEKTIKKSKTKEEVKTENKPQEAKTETKSKTVEQEKK